MQYPVEGPVRAGVQRDRRTPSLPLLLFSVINSDQFSEAINKSRLPNQPNTRTISAHRWLCSTYRQAPHTTQKQSRSHSVDSLVWLWHPAPTLATNCYQRLMAAFVSSLPQPGLGGFSWVASPHPRLGLTICIIPGLLKTSPGMTDNIHLPRWAEKYHIYWTNDVLSL